MYRIKTISNKKANCRVMKTHRYFITYKPIHTNTRAHTHVFIIYIYDGAYMFIVYILSKTSKIIKI